MSDYPKVPKDCTRSFPMDLVPVSDDGLAAFRRTADLFYAGLHRALNFLKRERDAGTEFWVVSRQLAAKMTAANLAAYFCRPTTAPLECLGKGRKGKRAADDGTKNKGKDLAKIGLSSKQLAEKHPGLPFPGWDVFPRKFAQAILRQAFSQVKSWDSCDAKTRAEYAKLWAESLKLQAEVPNGDGAAFANWVADFESNYAWRFGGRFVDYLLGRKVSFHNQYDSLAAAEFKKAVPGAAAGDEDSLKKLSRLSWVLRKLLTRRPYSDWTFSSPEDASVLRLMFGANGIGYRLLENRLSSIEMELLVPAENGGWQFKEFRFKLRQTKYLGMGHSITPIFPEADDKDDDAKKKRKKKERTPTLSTHYALKFARNRVYGGVIKELMVRPVAGKKGACGRVFFAYQAEVPVKAPFRDHEHVREVVRHFVTARGKEAGEKPPAGTRVMTLDIGIRPMATWVVCEGGPDNVVASGRIGGEVVDRQFMARVERLEAACKQFQCVREFANGNAEAEAECRGYGFTLANPLGDLKHASKRVRDALYAGIHVVDPATGKQTYTHINGEIGVEAILWAKWVKVALGCMKSSKFRGRKPLAPNERTPYLSTYRGYLLQYKRNLRRQLCHRLGVELERHGVHFLCPEDLAKFTVDGSRSRRDNELLSLWSHRQFLGDMTHVANTLGVTVIPVFADLSSQVDHSTNRFGYRSEADKTKLVVERGGGLEVVDADLEACLNLQHHIWTRYERASIRVYAHELPDGRFVAAPRDDWKAEKKEYPLGARLDGSIFTEFGYHYTVFERNCDGYLLTGVSKAEYEKILGNAYARRGTSLYRHGERYYPREEHQRRVEAIRDRAVKEGVIPREGGRKRAKKRAKKDYRSREVVKGYRG